MEKVDPARSLIWILLIGIALVAACGVVAWAFGAPFSVVFPSSALTVEVLAAAIVIQRSSVLMSGDDPMATSGANCE